MDSLSNAPSLLNYVDAPVVVSDPDGQVVFLNPAFEFCFATTRDRSEGRGLAELFEGGDREAILAAVATTCSRGQSVRFRIRHQERGFRVVASPIAVEGERVGTVLLLSEDPLETDGLLHVKRSLDRALSQLSDCLDHLALSDMELGGGERQGWVTGGRGALNECRRAVGNLGHMAEGQDRNRNAEASFEAARVVRDAVAGVAFELAQGGVVVDVLVSPDLPPVKGDGKRLQEALEALLRARLSQSPDWINVSASREADGDAQRVVIALTDPGPPVGPGAPPLVTEAVSVLGGRLEVSSREDGERTTRIRLPSL